MKRTQANPFDRLVAVFQPAGLDPLDQAALYRIRLLIGFASVGVLLALMFGLLFGLVLASVEGGLMFAGAGLCLLGILGLLRATGSVTLCSYLMGVTLLAICALVVWLRGGFAVSALAYLALTPFGAMLVGRRGGAVVSVLAAVLVATFFYAKLGGFFPDPVLALDAEAGMWLDALAVLGLVLAVYLLTSASESSRVRSDQQRRQIATRLEQSQRLESVGQLAGTVAHDFNNLLTVIRGSVDMALEQVEPRTDLDADLREIRTAAERAAALTRQLLLFSRREVVQPEYLQVDGLVREAAPLIRRSLREDISLELSLGGGSREILAERSQLEQAIINLAVNARDAMPKGGTLRIVTRTEPLESKPEGTGAFGADGEPVPPGDYLRIDVQDDGAGMSPEVSVRAFEPFFTTKGKALGTGLGLASVLGIVQRFRGYIWVESAPDEGTRFSILLPEVRSRVPAPDPVEPQVDSEPGLAVAGGGQAVLLVEDEAPVRRTVAQMLRKADYQVAEAADAEQALEMLSSGAVDPVVLVTDVIMPGLSGPALAKQVRRTHPIKVIFISGYTDGELSAQGLDLGSDRLLRKPFKASDIRRAVHQAIEG